MSSSPPRPFGANGTMPAPGNGATPLDGDAIKGLLEEVAKRLTPGPERHVVVIVGGALLAWSGLRNTTLDVDSVERLGLELQTAIAEVAEKRGLEPDWLNAEPARFRPTTLVVNDCEVLLETDTLVVRGAPLRVIFAMKLLRSQQNDLTDITKILPLAGFSSAAEAVEYFYESYPHALKDPELPDLVRQLARNGGLELSLD